MRRLCSLLLVVPLLLAAACGGTSTVRQSPGSSSSATRQALHGTVTVLAAASLTETFGTLAKRFEHEHPGVTVRLSFGASSTLAEQISRGAPADVFASAAPEPMAMVHTTGGSKVFARNRLEIVVPRGNPAHVSKLADFARPELRLAVCAAKVPCGEAATAAFRAAHVTPRPDTYGTDVKAVLTSVRLGEVDAGLVYRTDVRSAKGAVQGVDFPEASKAINDYPIAALADAPNPSAAKAFVAYVRSAAGQSVLRAAGFDSP